MGKRGRKVSLESLVSRLTETFVKVMQVVAEQSGTTAPVAVVAAPKGKRGRPVGSKNAPKAKKNKGGRPKGSKNTPKAKRGRPVGSKNAPKAKRGRPVGSKNKVAAPVTSSTKAKRGRPKGSKNKVVVAATVATATPVVAAEPKQRGRKPNPVTQMVNDGIAALKTDSVKKQALEVYRTAVEGVRIASPKKVKKLIASLAEMDGRNARTARRLVITAPEQVLMKQMKDEGALPRLLAVVFHTNAKEVEAALSGEAIQVPELVPATAVKKTKKVTVQKPKIAAPVAAPVAADPAKPATISAPAPALVSAPVAPVPAPVA